MQSAMVANDETRRVMTFRQTNDSTGFSAEIPTHGAPTQGPHHAFPLPAGCVTVSLRHAAMLGRQGDSSSSRLRGRSKKQSLKRTNDIR